MADLDYEAYQLFQDRMFQEAEIEEEKAKLYS